MTKETHEFAHVPGTNFMILSQMSNSQLLKIDLDPTTQAVVGIMSFPMGRSHESGLHGVWPSTLYPGKMWLTLQKENKLLLVDPGKDMATVPIIIKEINIPKPGNGPHCVFEIGNRVWAGLKEASHETGGYYVYSADIPSIMGQTSSNVTDQRWSNTSNAVDQKLYPCLNSPVFIVEEPETKLIYVTQDVDSSIMRINTTSGETTQMAIPPSYGNTPVGLIAGHGRMSGVWFTLAGNKTGGQGSFGRITPKGEMQMFNLRSIRSGKPGLLHLADASTKEGGPALWLVSTSLLSIHSPDALIRVTFDDDVASMKHEELLDMPTQNAMLHRVRTMNDSVFVSELNTFSLAHVKYTNVPAGQWLPSQATEDRNVGFVFAKPA
ncbi:hypothetical protein AAL_07370 [Moelleriella libera RCEF 2490]|uniref:Uncharacterized protein n=1 Tax=Moelleriella libera RCEF 2490 TaxID=1081109 RepID=A0A167XN18_9HYPO|nr:hypothetical protein AAL_07370 [Moelleriella libera RCEF 2490]